MKTFIRFFTIGVAAILLVSFSLNLRQEGTTKKDTIQPVSTAGTTNPTQPLSGKTIIIDPGHGGKDVGTIGGQNSYEKDVTLPTALKIQRKLKEKGANVILTRSDDETVSLSERANIANNHEADLFVSIHFDAFDDPDVHGITVYYNKTSDESLAQQLHDGIFKSDLKAKDRGVKFGDYRVLRENIKPAILLELGYLSNKNEKSRITSTSYQELLSTAVVRGIVDAIT
ncbi:N-acetylmuramoyl-L-alanine amidase family protein [Paenibacillus oceani]|uniref:N-acetylmuramoyl-L-alanine amidase n=1 Tax=Paenibacillus oceani TaxID=2772510 RepID=A0A927CA61_9BACL|nr:N-acetylmuramoyl-L-alanine amidase [Paenibacillus oceani]MBD2862837.1 N-acetylmuramoyl-L-alanine amidase [Paenibacillus oceani]